MSNLRAVLVSISAAAWVAVIFTGIMCGADNPSTPFIGACAFAVSVSMGSVAVGLYDRIRTEIELMRHSLPSRPRSVSAGH